MTPEAIDALARDIAEAAAKCIRDGAHTVEGHAVTVIVPGSDWRVSAHVLGKETAALRCAAVLALRDCVVAQREERARMLAADDAALRVIDETARIYDAATLNTAIGDVCAKHERNPDAWRRDVARWLTEPSPWTRAQLGDVPSGETFADACDAVLRRRAGGAP